MILDDEALLKIILAELHHFLDGLFQCSLYGAALEDIWKIQLIQNLFICLKHLYSHYLPTNAEWLPTSFRYSIDIYGQSLLQLYNSPTLQTLVVLYLQPFV